MSAQPSIKIVKRMGYRAGSKDWSNRHHFTGSNPTGNAQWEALADNIVAAEKALWNSGDMTIIQAVGYNAGSDVPVWSKAYTQAGTGSFTSINATPGATAALIRWTTTQRSTKNHPIYLNAYMHGPYVQGGSAQDTQKSTQKTAMQTYATAWVNGFSDGTNTRIRCGPNGAVAQAGSLADYLTHRDFPS